MGAKNVYTWLMIADLIATITLDILSEMEIDKEMSREDWLQASADLKERRKAAMDKIKAH